MNVCRPGILGISQTTTVTYALLIILIVSNLARTHARPNTTYQHQHPHPATALHPLQRKNSRHYFMNGPPHKGRIFSNPLGHVSTSGIVYEYMRNSPNGQRRFITVISLTFFKKGSQGHGQCRKYTTWRHGMVILPHYYGLDKRQEAPHWSLEVRGGGKQTHGVDRIFFG